MRVVIYGPESCGALGFMAEGARARGHHVLFREDRQAYKRNYVEADKFDLAVTDGLREPMDLMRDEYKATGLPVLVTDLGFFRCRPGYQVGLWQLNWLPDFECPSDRFDSLNIQLKDRVPGDNIVITGQKPGDASHNMDEAELTSMYQGWVDKVRQHTDRPIVFRPHPRAKHMRLEGEGVSHDIPSNAQDGGYPELLENAHAVLTHVSTSGTEALIAGVPVFCSPEAQYAPVANLDWSKIESPYFPERETLYNHFCKVAYAQWTAEEVRGGQCFEFFEGVIQ